MIQTIRKAWGIPELKKKIIFTLLILLIFRIGNAITVPYIDVTQLEAQLKGMGATILGLYNVMSGGAFATATVFALSIQPYINSSIIIQLLTVAIPALERMQREGGEEGKKKIQSITRYATVAIALLQAVGYYAIMQRYCILTDQSIWAALVIIVSFIAGSSFLMWLGEQCNEFGVGNGISMILFAGILSRVPSMINSAVSGVQDWFNKQNGLLTLDGLTTYNQLQGYGAEAAAEAAQNRLNGALAPWLVPLLLIGLLALIMFVVYIQNAERKIPVQYAKRVVGRKMYGGQSSHIPLKVNMSGVLPIIFAQSIASLPATVGMFFGKTAKSGGGWGTFLTVFNSNGWVYAIVYFLLILAFSYFYSTMQFDPTEVANNLKANGGFVPGFRPGKPTADFIRKVLSKITFFGAMFLSVIAILPIVTGNISGMSGLALGGTSIIIVVGVALETSKALEAQLMMRHYKGFLE